MKQPDLEEALRMFVRGRDLTVQRQTMSDSVSKLTLTTPSGKTRTFSSRRPSPASGARPSRPTSSDYGARPTARSMRSPTSGQPIRANSPR
jgi:hypothetical protein